MADTATKLDVKSRAADGSRAARRLRRTGRVPGVLYGGEGEAVGFDADARELRLALASSGVVLPPSMLRSSTAPEEASARRSSRAVLDLSIDGGKTTPVVLKEAQRDPV